MAETIKGINVVIGAETTGLQKALSDVNKKSRDIQSELRQVERLLRLDPTNTELLAQRQRLLSDAVANTREKLDRLCAAQEQVNDQFARGEISEGQYRAFQREVVAAEQQLQRFEDQLEQTSQASRNLGESLNNVGQRMTNAGKSLSMAVTAPIVGAFAAITQGTKELRGDLATLATNAQVAGQDMETLNDAMVKLQAVTGETDSNVEGLSELLATGFRDEQLTQLLDSLYGAAIKFKDTMKFEGIADGLQETLATGAAIGPFGELLERSGVNLDKFNAGLKRAIANGREEKYILEVLAKTGLAETYEAYRKNNEEMVKAEEANIRMQFALAQLGATLEPILTPIITKITELVNKFNDMSPAGQKIVIVIAGIAAVIGPVLMALGMAAQGFAALSGVIGSIITAIGILLSGGGIAGLAAAFPALGTVITSVGAIFTALTGPIGIAIAAIAALIAIGVVLYKNWDAIAAGLTQIWAGIKQAAENVWNTIKDFFKKWGDEILLIAAGPAGWAVLLAKRLDINWDEIKQKAIEIWESLKDFLKEWGDEILLIAAGPAGWITLLAEKLGISWEDIKTTAIEIWEGIVTSLEELWTKIKEKAGDIWDEIKKAITEPIENVKAEVLGFVADIENAFTNMKMPLSKLPSLSIENADSTSGVRWYGSGGIFNSPSVIGVGESGPEAVVPIDKLPTLLADTLKQVTGGGGDTFILNVKMDEVDEVYKLVNVVKQVKQTRRAGLVGV